MVYNYNNDNCIVVNALHMSSLSCSKHEQSHLYIAHYSRHKKKKQVTDRSKEIEQRKESQNTHKQNKDM